MRNLKGKNCFITGAASGIGRATALAAAAQGARLFLCDLNAQRLEDTVLEIRRSGGEVVLSGALDVADFDAVEAFAKRIHAAFGSMDVVMNIAGISLWGTVDKLEHRHWRKIVDVNLMGPIHVIECFVPAMIRAKRGGHLVNVSSAAGLFGLPWHAAYSASKFGLRGVSEVLRFDLEQHGIAVHLVCPGAVDTGLVETLEIVGVDRKHPVLQRAAARFREHAVTPETAATAILRGVARGDYLIFTSRDIRVGHWIQNKLGFLYERWMRRLSARMERTVSRARTTARADTGGRARNFQRTSAELEAKVTVT